MLGLNLSDDSFVRFSMITCSDSLAGFEIIETLGVAEGIVEKSFPIIEISHIGFAKGGGLDELIEEAKMRLATLAHQMGANAIIGLRYEIMGRSVEKSALAYGTAVKCKRTELQ